MAVFCFSFSGSESHAVRVVILPPNSDYLETARADKAADNWIGSVDDRALSLRGEIYRTGSYGRRRSRPIREDAIRTVQIADMSARGHKGAIHWRSNLGIRWTNDEFIRDRDDPHITQISIDVNKGKVWRLKLGDFSPNWSPYTLLRSLEGIEAEMNFDRGEDELRVTALGASAQRGRDLLQFRRWVGGLNARYNIPRQIGPFRSASIGAAFVVANDDNSSIKNIGSARDLRYKGLSITPVLNYKRWRLAGEFSKSLGTSDALVNSVNAHGSAARFSLSYRRADPERPWKFLLLPREFHSTVELVGPDFIAPLGAATADRFRFGGSATWKLLRPVTFIASHYEDSDNVHDKADPTNRSHNTAMNLELELPIVHSFLGQSRLNLDFRRSARSRTDGAVNTKNEVYRAELNHYLLGFRFSEHYEWELADDEVNAANDRRLANWAVAVNRTFTRNELSVTPRGSYRRSIDHTLYGTEYTRSHSYLAGLDARWREFSLLSDFTYRDFDRNSLASDAVTEVISSHFGYRPKRFLNTEFGLQFRYTDYEDDDPTNSYRLKETRLTWRTLL